MVIPLGALVNAAAVIAGAFLGLTAGRIISQPLRESLFQTLGLCTIVIGLTMALSAENFMPALLSCVLGIIVGESMAIATRLDQAGEFLKKLLHSKNEHFTEGFITASILTCAGAMGIVGAFEEGLGGGPTTLFTKSILDFFAVMMLATVYGAGVALAALPIFIYFGSLTLLAAQLTHYMTPPIKDALVSTGGIMILAIGLGLIGLKPIKVSNLLPALIFAIIFGAVL
ncbi:MAG: DUF554 domain-containing protein [Candidatus Adiutrix sp.]